MRFRAKVHLELYEDRSLRSLDLVVKFKMPKKIFKVRLEKTLVFDATKYENFWIECESQLNIENLKKAARQMVEDYLRARHKEAKRTRVKNLINEINEQGIEIDVEYEPSYRFKIKTGDEVIKNESEN